MTADMKQKTCLFRRSWKAKAWAAPGEGGVERQAWDWGPQGKATLRTAEPGMPTGRTRANEKMYLRCFGTMGAVGPRNGAQRQTGR